MSISLGNKIPVFDIGNVLIRWDMKALISKLFDTDAEVEHFLTKIWSPEWNLEQDRGKPWDIATKELSEKHPDYTDAIMALDKRWMETITGSIDGTVKILKYYKDNNIPVYAITNFAADKLIDCQARFEFLNWFTSMTVSGTVEMIKPNTDIYQRFLDDHGFSAEQIHFIDDSIDNITSANKFGFNATLFKNPEQFQKDWQELGMLDKSINLL